MTCRTWQARASYLRSLSDPVRERIHFVRANQPQTIDQLTGKIPVRESLFIVGIIMQRAGKRRKRHHGSLIFATSQRLE